MAGARKVGVAALQFAWSDSVSDNVGTSERLVKDAYKKGANIILIQEIENQMLNTITKLRMGPTLMQQVAKELGVVIPVNFFEEANNAHYNSVAVY